MAKKVLVVDDDPNIQKIVTIFLQTEGCDVITASNGRDALEMISKDKPELMFLDVMMPVMDGYEVCKQIKAQPALKDIPIVMFTAKGSLDDIQKAIRAGADDYVIKPFSKDVLIAKLTKVEKMKKIKSEILDRRNIPRNAVGMFVTWKEKKGMQTVVAFKERVIDISPIGLSFEHRRCDICTGYIQGGVHPLCPFAKFGQKFAISDPLYVVLSFPDGSAYEIKCKVVHVFQPPEWRETEKVGIAFEMLPAEIAEKIKALPPVSE